LNEERIQLEKSIDALSQVTRSYEIVGNDRERLQTELDIERQKLESIQNYVTKIQANFFGKVLLKLLSIKQASSES
jgi:hypothetical protein